MYCNLSSVQKYIIIYIPYFKKGTNLPSSKRFAQAFPSVVAQAVIEKCVCVCVSEE